MGCDDLFKKAKDKKEKRRQSTRGKVKESILILCEGTKTEPNYFGGFKEAYRLANVKIEGCGTNTDRLIEKAKNYLKEYDQIWCVFDRDSFPPHNFNRAFLLTKKHPQIKIAYSNESFELWYLLHFNLYDSIMNRTQYIDKLSDLLGYQYQKNSSNMYKELLEKQKDAIKNAKTLLATYPNPNPEQDNPSTTVHLLVEELNKYRI